MKNGKKILLTAITVITAVFMISFGTIAIAKSDTLEKGVISVSANVDREFAPDTVKINLSIETSGKDLNKAAEENRIAAQKVIEAVKKMINVNNGDMIKTIGYSATPQYAYKNSVRIFDKYTVVNSLTVRTKSIDNIGKIIQTATANGANKVESLNYTLEDYDKACSALMEEATVKTKTQALKLANTLGKKGVELKSLSANCSSDNQSPTYRNFMYSKAALDTAEGVNNEVPTEAGKIKLNATINAEYISF